ncbi:MAG: tetratricopeptide repeat protein [Rhodocyclaceae bacterium]|jgi:protein O-GlcNAc transferase|nr:tetratricopeptide repeat protein [Rhodocyclaceae bacterium]
MPPKPDCPATRAVRHLREGQPSQAKDVLALACESGTSDPYVWFLYGASLHQLGELPAALSAFERAIHHDPGNPQAHSARASVLAALSRLAEALEACNAALVLSPDDPQLLHNTASILEDMGHVDAALAGYQQAIQRKPDFLPSLINRAILLARANHLDLAFAAALDTVKLHPKEPEGWYQLGDIYLAQLNPEKSLDSFQHVLNLMPDHLAAMMGKGMALSALGNFDDAFEAFSLVRQKAPGFYENYRSVLPADYEDASMARDPRRVFFVQQFMRLERCDWSERERFHHVLCDQIRQPRRYSTPLQDRGLPHPALAFDLDPLIRLELARQVAEGVAASVGSQARFTGREPDPGKRLRLGYVSPDFRQHATAHLTRRLYVLHDRSRFEVFAYSLKHDDESGLAGDIRKGCDRFRQLDGVDAATLIRQIRKDDIDILVDLAGYTRFARPEIFAARCAPLQTGYLGFPSTLGGGALDYVMTDAIICPPGSEIHWSESLVRLPGTYAIYDDAVPVSVPSSRAQHFLPEGATVLCGFNAAWKLSPEMFAVWMRLLKRLPDAVLWLWGSQPSFRDNLSREARLAGVSPKRLVFCGPLEKSAHLARYFHADLFLDTLPCNAHTTAADALWMGVPVLTCLGREMQGRVAASLVQAAGLPELVANNLNEYESLAYRLVSEPGVLSGLHEKLAARKQSGELFNTRRKVRDLEKAYEMIWNRYCDGLSPAAFQVPAEAC